MLKNNYGKVKMKFFQEYVEFERLDLRHIHKMLMSFIHNYHQDFNQLSINDVKNFILKEKDNLTVKNNLSEILTQNTLFHFLSLPFLILFLNQYGFQNQYEFKSFQLSAYDYVKGTLNLNIQLVHKESQKQYELCFHVVISRIRISMKEKFKEFHYDVKIPLLPQTKSTINDYKQIFPNAIINNITGKEKREMLFHQIIKQEIDLMNIIKEIDKYICFALKTIP